MTPFEIADALQSFRIIADTREQWTPKTKERFASFGVPVDRATLLYGDYCGQIALPDGMLHNTANTIAAPCVIERKMSLDELAMCFTRGRDRFKREFERASANNARVYLLVENATWEALLNHRYRSRFNQDAFKASLAAWTVRYNLTPVFCKANTSGIVIKEILYRDIKERLERGEYG